MSLKDPIISKLMEEELSQAPNGRHNLFTLAVRRDDSTLPYVIGFGNDGDAARDYMDANANGLRICNSSHPAVSNGVLLVSSVITDPSVERIVSLSTASELEHLIRSIPRVVSVRYARRLLERGAVMYVNERENGELPRGCTDAASVMESMKDSREMRKVTAQRQLSGALSAVGQALFSVEGRNDVSHHMMAYTYARNGRDVLRLVLGDMLDEREWAEVDAVCDIWWQKSANILQSLYWDWNADMPECDDEPAAMLATKLSPITELARVQRLEWQDLGRGVIKLDSTCWTDIVDGIVPGTRTQDIELMVKRMYEKGFAQQYEALVSGVPLEDVLA